MNYGRYKILKEIGKGSMGVVYQAHDPNLDVMVALKVLRQDRLSGEAFVRRFLAEARALGRLDHPNIVRVYNVDEDSGTVYIAMEFIEGEALSEVMKKKQFSFEEIVNMGNSVADTLSHAHQKGIVHRDIKPSNILLRSDGRLKITDFGIAHMEDSSATQQTQAGEILGTPAYMSPEQVMSKPVDGRSDLFSLGIILYELSTGRRPFTGENLPAVFNAITHMNPPEPSRLNPKIPRGLSQIIMKCLAKNPDERFQTGKALVDALRETVSGKGRGPTAERGKKKAVMLIGAGVVSFLLVVGIVAGLILRGNILKPNPNPTQSTLEEKTGGRTENKIGATSLKVESSPVGAQVFIDGASKGPTPLNLELPAGKYEVRVTLANYYDWEAQVSIQEGSETPLFVSLVPVEEKKL